MEHCRCRTRLAPGIDLWLPLMRILAISAETTRMKPNTGRHKLGNVSGPRDCLVAPLLAMTLETCHCERSVAISWAGNAQHVGHGVIKVQPNPRPFPVLLTLLRPEAHSWDIRRSTIRTRYSNTRWKRSGSSHQDRKHSWGRSARMLYSWYILFRQQRGGTW